MDWLGIRYEQGTECIERYPRNIYSAVKMHSLVHMSNIRYVAACLRHSECPDLPYTAAVCIIVRPVVPYMQILNPQVLSCCCVFCVQLQPPWLPLWLHQLQQSQTPKLAVQHLEVIHHFPTYAQPPIFRAIKSYCVVTVAAY